MPWRVRSRCLPSAPPFGRSLCGVSVCCLRRAFALRAGANLWGSFSFASRFLAWLSAVLGRGHGCRACQCYAAHPPLGHSHTPCGTGRGKPVNLSLCWVEVSSRPRILFCSAFHTQFSKISVSSSGAHLKKIHVKGQT